MAHTGMHPGATSGAMESAEREEPSGALLAFDWQAPPRPLQDFSSRTAIGAPEMSPGMSALYRLAPIPATHPPSSLTPARNEASKPAAKLHKAR
jgi:hypothetical protein